MFVKTLSPHHHHVYTLSFLNSFFFCFSLLISAVEYNAFLLCSIINYSLTNLRKIKSPSSAGRLRSLLLERSRCRKFVRLAISPGILVKLLSFRYNVVRWDSPHSWGLRLRIVPAKLNTHGKTIGTKAKMPSRFSF
jgi:hypothetical protein